MATKLDDAVFIPIGASPVETDWAVKVPEPELIIETFNPYCAQMFWSEAIVAAKPRMDWGKAVMIVNEVKLAAAVLV